MQVSFRITPIHMPAILSIIEDNFCFYKNKVEGLSSTDLERIKYTPLLGVREPHEGDDTLTLEGTTLTFTGTREELHRGGVHWMISRILNFPLVHCQPLDYAPDAGEETKRWFEE